MCSGKFVWLYSNKNAHSQCTDLIYGIKYVALGKYLALRKIDL